MCGCLCVSARCFGPSYILVGRGVRGRGCTMCLCVCVVQRDFHPQPPACRWLRNACISRDRIGCWRWCSRVCFGHIIIIIIIRVEQSYPRQDILCAVSLCVTLFAYIHTNMGWGGWLLGWSKCKATHDHHHNNARTYFASMPNSPHAIIA